MHPSPPHPATAALRLLLRLALSSLLAIGLITYWGYTRIITGWLPIIPLWILIAGVIGYGAVFGQLRYSVVAFLATTALGVLLHDSSRWLPGWVEVFLLFAIASFVCGLVLGRVFLSLNDKAEGKAIPWVYAFIFVCWPGVIVRILLEPLLSRIRLGWLMEPPKWQTQRRRIPAASLAGGGLYFMTLVIEGVCALIRTALLYMPMLFTLLPLHIVVLMVTRDDYFGPIPGLFGPTNEYGIDNTRWMLEGVWLILRYTLLITALVGFGPVLLSLFHALVPFTRTGAGATEIESLGAREPTRAEHATILDALQVIQDRAGSDIAAPSHWRIIDDPVPDAYTIGSTIYLARGAVESPQLAGLVAHELGHIAHKDGDLVLALRRFIIPVAYYIGIDRHPMPAGTVVSTGAGVRQRLIRTEDEKIYYRFHTLQIKFWLAFWLGGMGLLLLGQHWAHFWRQRDFLADDYAVDLGFDEQLVESLQLYRHVDVAQPFLLSNRPYTAERLDRLQG